MREEIERMKLREEVENAPMYMSRTSDSIGSFVYNDINDYIRLICRRVKERCSTARELMFMIRKMKNSDENRITKSQFRHTLVKFGVILPTQIFDPIFNIFDDDRSGSIEIDEFVSHVMNEQLDNVKPQHSRKGALRLKTAAKISESSLSNSATENPSTSLALNRPMTVTKRKGSSLKPLVNVQPGSFMLFGGNVEAVERRFRDALRQGEGFRLLREQIEQGNPAIAAVHSNVLYSLLYKHCGAISKLDYRLMLAKFKVDDQNRVDWLHFVDTFDPHKIGPPTTRLPAFDRSSKMTRGGSRNSFKPVQKTMSMGAFCGYA